jgi:hypothetical protein
MAKYIRQVKTKSGRTAVQIEHKNGRKRFRISTKPLLAMIDGKFAMPGCNPLVSGLPPKKSPKIPKPS